MNEQKNGLQFTVTESKITACVLEILASFTRHCARLTGEEEER